MYLNTHFDTRLFDCAPQGQEERINSLFSLTFLSSNQIVFVREDFLYHKKPLYTIRTQNGITHFITKDIISMFDIADYIIVGTRCFLPLTECDIEKIKSAINKVTNRNYEYIVA